MDGEGQAGLDHQAQRGGGRGEAALEKSAWDDFQEEGTDWRAQTVWEKKKI